MSEFESCGFCGRTILRGEQAARYLDPDRTSELVCALCKGRAEASGWLPAAVAEAMPPPPKRRRGLVALRERLVALRAAVEPEAPVAPPAPQPPPPPRTPLEVFNSSGEARKVAGLRKSLGEPRVTVRTERDAELITVAWDLSWYRWSVRGESVKQIAKGNEISELPVEDRAWNASAAEDGTLSRG